MSVTCIFWNKFGLYAHSEILYMPVCEFIQVFFLPTMWEWKITLLKYFIWHVMHWGAEETYILISVMHKFFSKQELADFNVLLDSYVLWWWLNGACCEQNTSQVIIYEVTRTKTRHKRLREVMLPTQAQTLNILAEGRLCVGYQSGFSIYSIMGDQHPLCEYRCSFATIYICTCVNSFKLGLNF
jgi:hypothetical protein